MSATSGQVLTWNGTAWAPQSAPFSTTYQFSFGESNFVANAVYYPRMGSLGITAFDQAPAPAATIAASSMPIIRSGTLQNFCVFSSAANSLGAGSSLRFR